MAQQKNTRLEKQHLNAMEDMADREMADNESEAHRMLLNAGMREYGYENGGYNGNGGLATACRKVGWVFAIIAFTWGGTTFFWPVELRMPALAFALAAVLSFGLERVVDRYDGQRFGRLLGKGEKA